MKCYLGYSNFGGFHVFYHSILDVSAERAEEVIAIYQNRIETGGSSSWFSPISAGEDGKADIGVGDFQTVSKQESRHCLQKIKKIETTEGDT